MPFAEVGQCIGEIVAVGDDEEQGSDHATRAPKARIRFDFWA